MIVETLEEIQSQAQQGLTPSLNDMEALYTNATKSEI